MWLADTARTVSGSASAQLAWPARRGTPGGGPARRRSRLEQPEAGGARAAHAGAERARAERSAVERSAQLRAQRERGRARGRSPRPPRSTAGGARGQAPQRLGIELLARTRRMRSSSAYTSPAEALAAAGRAPRRAPGSSSGSTRSPVPVTSAWRGSTWLGHVGAERRPRCRAAPPASSGSPASSLAARSAAAASALPPPRPAATGMRFSIARSSGGSSPPSARRGMRAIARAARFSPATPGQITRPRRRRAARQPRARRRARARRTASRSDACRRRGAARPAGRG